MTRFSRATLDDGFGELLEVVDRIDALHLRQQPPEQAEVAATEKQYLLQVGKGRGVRYTIR